ncbi:helix-turn-helix domain-containing protein [Butyrivibrio sp. M55]|uniref:helix-turn-helix domain-containing protein n=1 Tax=Butyrivibrio sp. M55 TaxID=1855323 RepID=UPI0008EFED37|nr:helix-turn-helix transcriptional regulator [Butyrivibrio sp. M55]SFU66161.1 Helix-turn-helix [Butyrivibrio sp. M55]
MCTVLDEIETRGIEKGIEKGRDNTLIALVHDGLLSVEIAADRAGVSIDEFKAMMKKRYITDMTIRDRIFDKLQEMKLTQKEFAKRTGIAESTISDWRKKNTNPTAEKIMIICKVLDVTPEWLLSGIETYRDISRGI